MAEESALHRPWGERSSSVGALPGKKENLTDVLRRVLTSLPATSEARIVVVRANGVSVEEDLGPICQRHLSPMGLVKRNTDGMWIPTAGSSAWLADGSDEDLAVYLHGRVKYFGELLQALPTKASRADLLQHAESYGFFWSTPDQIHRRITWLSCLGLVERWGDKYVLTASGEAFLGRVVLATPEEACSSSSPPDSEPDEIPEAAEWIAALLNNLTASALRKRKAIIGYIPRGRKARDRSDDGSGAGQSLIESVRAVCDILGDGGTADELFQRCNSQLGMKKSSFTSTLHSFRHLGAIDMVSFQRYGVSPDFYGLLELGSEVDLIRYLHSRYAFVAEILRHAETPTPVGELARVAAEQYGAAQIDPTEVRSRLGFLSDAGLIERIDWTRYRTTKAGAKFAGSVPLQQPLTSSVAGTNTEPTDNEDDRATVESICEELRTYAFRNDSSAQLEAAVSKAFKFLGFHSEHLGGSGRTDVLVTAELVTAERYKAIVEVKSSAGGVVAENNIKFDALRDHKGKHHADYGLVVGPGFGGRIRDWAITNGFTLLTVEDLASALRRHERGPLTLTELRVLFERTGDDLTDLEEHYSSAERSIDLVKRLMGVLYAEATDDEPLQGGSISRDNISYALKSMNPRPSREEVDSCLQLLTHELVRGAVQEGGQFRLADAPANVMRRLAGLGMGLEQLDTQNEP